MKYHDRYCNDWQIFARIAAFLGRLPTTKLLSSLVGFAPTNVCLPFFLPYVLSGRYDTYLQFHVRPLRQWARDTPLKFSPSVDFLCYL